MTARDWAADDALLVLVREHDIGRELFEEKAETLGAEVANRAPGREVDAHGGACRPRVLDCTARGEPDRLAKQRVTRHVEMLAPFEPGLVDLLGPEFGCNAPVGAHRSLTRGMHERDDHAVPLGLDRADKLDSEIEQSRRREHSGVVCAPLADEA